MDLRGVRIVVRAGVMVLIGFGYGAMREGGAPPSSPGGLSLGQVALAGAGGGGERAVRVAEGGPSPRHFEVFARVFAAGGAGGGGRPVPRFPSDLVLARLRERFPEEVAVYSRYPCRGRHAAPRAVNALYPGAGSAQDAAGSDSEPVDCVARVLEQVHECLVSRGIESRAASLSLGFFLDGRLAPAVQAATARGDCVGLAELEPSEAALVGAREVLDAAFTAYGDGAVAPVPGGSGWNGADPALPALAPAATRYEEFRKALGRSCAGRRLLRHLEEGSDADPDLPLALLARSLERSVLETTGKLVDGTSPELTHAAMELKRAGTGSFCDEQVAVMILLDEWSARAAGTRHRVPLIRRLKERASMPGHEEIDRWIAAELPILWEDAIVVLSRAVW